MLSFRLKSTESYDIHNDYYMSSIMFLKASLPVLQSGADDTTVITVVIFVGVEYTFALTMTFD